MARKSDKNDALCATERERTRAGESAMTFHLNACRYEGEYVENKMHGRGTFIYANGDRSVSAPPDHLHREDSLAPISRLLLHF